MNHAPWTFEIAHRPGIYAIKTNNDEIIANVKGLNFARLIAAAPELLEALNTIQGMIDEQVDEKIRGERQHISYAYLMQSIIDTAAEAIRKANVP